VLRTTSRLTARRAAALRSRPAARGRDPGIGDHQVERSTVASPMPLDEPVTAVGGRFDFVCQEFNQGLYPLLEICQCCADADRARRQGLDRVALRVPKIRLH
jgi:hypothetical protein